MVLLCGQLLREGLLVLGGGWEHVCDIIVIEDDDLFNGGLVFEEKEEMHQPSVLVQVYSISAVNILHRKLKYSHSMS